MWISVFFGGIGQFFHYIFSWKNRTPFWRVIWSIFAGCFLAFTCMVGYSFCKQMSNDQRRKSYDDPSINIGADYAFYNDGEGKSYIYDKATGKRIHEGLDWIAVPEDGDSLLVFAKDGKRGYLSRNSANIIIPAKYDAAWCFNDGVAGVCEGDSVYFIDHAGKPIFSRKFKREPGHNYTFHGNLFVVREGDKYGLVDRQGHNATELIYEGLETRPNNMWITMYDGKMGAINEKGMIVVPNQFKGVSIYPDDGIVVTLKDNSKKRLDYEGNVTDDFIFDFTGTMEYDSDELDENGICIKKAADLSYYSSCGHIGLIDKSGRPITPPIYDSIKAFSADLFECTININGDKLLINSKGQKVN